MPLWSQQRQRAMADAALQPSFKALAEWRACQKWNDQPGIHTDSPGELLPKWTSVWSGQSWQGLCQSLPVAIFHDGFRTLHGRPFSCRWWQLEHNESLGIQFQRRHLLNRSSRASHIFSPPYCNILSFLKFQLFKTERTKIQGYIWLSICMTYW